MDIEVLNDADAVARKAAAIIAGEARQVVAARGRFVLAVSGGHTPWLMLRALANEDVPWNDVHVAQVDERGSKQEYMAANDIDTAERQLIFVLAKWEPDLPGTGYKATLYGGMRIQATRAPDVKVHYIFTFNEWVIRRDDAPIFDDDFE